MSNNHRWATHPGGQSLTAGAEWPEHRVAQTLQNLLQHLQRTREQRVRAERALAGERGMRLRTLSKTKTNMKELFFFLKSSSPAVDTSCGAAAVQLLSGSRRGDRSSNSFHWQRSWQLATREEKVASELEVNMRRILQQCTKLTCGKPWVFSAWLKFLQFVQR